jgi:hypothetical protein
MTLVWGYTCFLLLNLAVVQLGAEMAVGTGLRADSAVYPGAGAGRKGGVRKKAGLAAGSQ